MTPAHYGIRTRKLAWRWGLDLRVAQCCLEQCDMRSHDVSEYVEGGSAEAEDVVRASVEARPHPDVRGWVLLSRVRSSGGKPKGPRPVRGAQVRGRLGTG